MEIRDFRDLWPWPPLVAGATTFPPRWEACHLILSRLRLLANPVPLPPQAGALWMLSHGAMSLQESIERFILSPGWGKVRRSRIRGGERSELIRRMLFMPYDTESQSRNADFISIARRAIRHPQRRRRCRPLSEANITRRRQAATTFGPEGRQPFSSQPFYTTRGASRAPFFKSAASAATTTL